MLDKNKQEVDMAYGTDSQESDSEESDSEKSDSMDMAQENKAMLLLEVIQSAVMLALDGGISVDTDMFHIKLEDDGSVSVRGVDDSGTELEVVSTVDDIMSAMGE